MSTYKNQITQSLFDLFSLNLNSVTQIWRKQFLVGCNLVIKTEKSFSRIQLCTKYGITANQGGKITWLQRLQIRRRRHPNRHITTTPDEDFGIKFKFIRAPFSQTFRIQKTLFGISSHYYPFITDICERFSNFSSGISILKCHYSEIYVPNKLVRKSNCISFILDDRFVRRFTNEYLLWISEVSLRKE